MDGHVEQRICPDSLGDEGFLTKYGFGRARYYVLWHEGHSYDSRSSACGPTRPSRRIAAWPGPAGSERRCVLGRPGTYVNHLGDEGEARVREAYGTSYDRLVALKQTWDPGNTFRPNQDSAPLPKC